MAEPDPHRPVVVLGAGIVGICCALSLAERGLRVTLIDRGAPGQETSFGNAGVISPWSIIPQAMPGIWKKIPHMLLNRDGPLGVRAGYWPRMVPWGLKFLRESGAAQVRRAADAMEVLCAPSIELYRRHLIGTGAEGLIQDSWYVHAFRDASRVTLSSLDYAIRREKGGDLELIGADTLRRTEPALSHDFNAAVLIKGQARTLSPGRLGAVLAQKARDMGVKVIQDEIKTLQRQDGAWRIRCATQEIAAARVVLSMGAWSPHILKPLGVHLPLAAERGYHVEFPMPGIVLNNSVMDVDAKTVASSMEGGLRVAGQAEFADVNAPASPRREALLIRQAQSAFPDLEPGQPRFWMGRRPSFPDSLPALGEVEGQNGLFCCFGHSHYGLMMAPKSGELLAGLVTGERTNVELAPYAPARFG